VLRNACFSLINRATAWKPKNRQNKVRNDFALCDFATFRTLYYITFHAVASRTLHRSCSSNCARKQENSSIRRVRHERDRETRITRACYRIILACVTLFLAPYNAVDKVSRAESARARRPRFAVSRVRRCARALYNLRLLSSDVITRNLN